VEEPLIVARHWPYARASGDHTIDVLRRLRIEIPTGKLIVLWDAAPSHRAKAVCSAAASLDIHLLPLPSYSPDCCVILSRNDRKVLQSAVLPGSTS
jgi:DDE superfamily endonuclease